MKNIFNLKNKKVKILAKSVLTIYLFSVIYTVIFAAGWSQTYDYETRTINIPNSVCYVSNDGVAVMFVKCEEWIPSFVEKILSFPLNIVQGSFFILGFFVYGTIQLLTLGDDNEPLLWLMLLPMALAEIYLGILMVLYVWESVKNKFRNQS